MYGISDFKPRTNIVKDEKGDLVTDSPLLVMWWNHFSQLFNVQWVSDLGRQKYTQWSN